MGTRLKKYQPFRPPYGISLDTTGVFRMVQNVFRKNAVFAHPDVFENVRMTGRGPHVLGPFKKIFLRNFFKRFFFNFSRFFCSKRGFDLFT